VVTPKGSRVKAELTAAANALRVLGAKAFTLPLAVDGPPQTIVIVVKQRPTPASYPRRSGIPAKQPL
jgi:16S rRNA (guanine527-N7)-methyltransferase